MVLYNIVLVSDHEIKRKLIIILCITYFVNFVIIKFIKMWLIDVLRPTANVY